MTERIDLSKYDLTFSDEFNSFSRFNGSSGNWKTEDYWGNRTLGGNGEKQLYVDPEYKGLGLNPFSIKDGALNIRAEKASASVKAAIGYDYTSGMIISEQSFSQQYGYFEIRAQMPAGKGLWPAFWLLPADGEWPPEYDVVEILGHEPDRLYGTSHYNNAAGEHKMDHAVNSKGLFNSADGYHTYGMDWQADKITWYYDGIKVGEAANRVTDQAMYMFANLAVGGYWPGNPDGSTKFPADMKIDWIRAYQKQSDHAAVGIPTDWKEIGISDFTVLTADGVRTTGEWRASMGASDQKLQLSGDWSRYATGNDRDNYIAGSNAQYNKLDGGRGNDTLIGNGGVDVFVLKNGNGNDVILDFSSKIGNSDKVQLDGFHFRHFDDVKAWMKQVGNDVILRLDQDQAVLFKNKKIADFEPEQFIFSNTVPAPKGPTVPQQPQNPDPQPEQPQPEQPQPEPEQPGGTTTKVVVRVSADSWNGDPVFKLLVDGKVVSAETKVTAQNKAGAWQDISFDVVLPSGASKIGIQYLNDDWGGTANTDRNLYVQSIKVGGVEVKAAAPEMKRAGTMDFAIPARPQQPEPEQPQPEPQEPEPQPEQPGGTTTKIVVRASADSWNGDPTFKLLVDGKVVSAEAKVTAQHKAGAWQDISFDVELPSGASKVGVQFLNDAWGGTPDTDRNLYVQSIKVGGVEVKAAVPEMKKPGTMDFAIPARPQQPEPQQPQPEPEQPQPEQPEPELPGGATKVVVRVSADSWQGDPLFKLLVDGKVVSAETKVTAQHKTGAWQDISFDVDLPSDASKLGVQFLNDDWGGTADTDRNLYVDQVTIGGVTIKAANPVMQRNGTSLFDVPDDLGLPSTPVPATQTVTVRASAESWNGDPMFKLLVDGVQLGADTKVTAKHGTQWQEFTFTLAEGADPSKLGIRYFNDDWGGSASTDRNLHVDWIKLGDRLIEAEDATGYLRDGKSTLAGQEKMDSNGTLVFELDHYADAAQGLF
jgi:beta-glucanase (GH16 family)